MSIDDATPGEWDAANARVRADRNEIDTAKLRARAIQQEWYEYESTVELCDALDAARAEAKKYRGAAVLEARANARAEAAEARLVDEQRRYTEACNNYSTLQLRAEAAEAERDRALFDEQNASVIWEARAEAAEARIAAALEALGQDYDPAATPLATAVYRALTGTPVYGRNAGTDRGGAEWRRFVDGLAGGKS